MDSLFGAGLTLGGFFTGFLIALKVIAPRTKNKYDDKALEVAEVIAPVIASRKSTPKKR